MEVRRVQTQALWAGDAAESSVVYSSEPCVDFSDERREKAPLKIHLGGALAVDRLTDTVYLTIGDYHLGASRISQAASAGIESTDLDYALLGDPSAAISALVAINIASGSASYELYSKGLRNPLGLAQDSDGRLWLSEMGPGGGDELNLMERGADYGWPLTSPGAPYDRSQWPANRDELPAPYLDFTDQDIPGTTGPIRVWTPAIAPSQLVWIPGDSLRAGQFAGLLALATLRDEAIHFLDPSQADVPTVARVGVGQRLRNMTADREGALWAVSDSGTLLKVSAG
jgi:glucose/arabinose dehydrogenase